MERPEHQTPIYKKAQDIEKLVLSIIDFVKDSDLPHEDDFDLEIMNGRLSEMKENAYEITVLISEASLPSMPYDFRMENAVFIKSAAHEIIEVALYIEDKGLKEVDYLDLLYDEIEALRILFREWINTFELWKYDCEDWGLFHRDDIKLIKNAEEDDENEFDNDEDTDDL